MKKIAAIALCSILLFNSIGYRLWISFLQDEAAVQLDSRLDQNNYDPAELVSVKVPASHLSSYTNVSSFKRTNGEVEIKGILYKYVAKRFFNDTLEFLCLPDRTAMKLKTAKNEFFSLVYDLKQCSSPKKADSHSVNSCIFSLDYINACELHLSTGLIAIRSPKSGYFLANLSHYFLLGWEQPPDRIS